MSCQARSILSQELKRLIFTNRTNVYLKIGENYNLGQDGKG